MPQLFPISAELSRRYIKWTGVDSKEIGKGTGFLANANRRVLQFKNGEIKSTHLENANEVAKGISVHLKKKKLPEISGPDLFDTPSAMTQFIINVYARYAPSKDKDAILKEIRPFVKKDAVWESVGGPSASSLNGPLDTETYVQRVLHELNTVKVELDENSLQDLKGRESAFVLGRLGTLDKQTVRFANLWNYRRTKSGLRMSYYVNFFFTDPA